MDKVERWYSSRQENDSSLTIRANQEIFRENLATQQNDGNNFYFKIAAVIRQSVIKFGIRIFE